jgi:hypothetical protein
MNVTVFRVDGAARVLLIALMIEAASTYEMSVSFYQTTRHNNPEDSHLRPCRVENLESQENGTS